MVLVFYYKVKRICVYFRVLFNIIAQLIKGIESKERKISTGCPVINEYLNGGLDRRCITEIYGESGCGKTQFGLQIVANCWESGKFVLSRNNTSTFH